MAHHLVRHSCCEKNEKTFLTAFITKAMLFYVDALSEKR